MAEQILTVKLQVLSGNSEQEFKNFEEAAKKAGLEIGKTMEAVDVENRQTIRTIQLTAGEVETLQKGFTKLRGDFNKTTGEGNFISSLKAGLVEVTKNADKAKAAIADTVKATLDFYNKVQEQSDKVRIAQKKADTIAAYAELETLEKRHLESIRAIADFEGLAELAANKRRIEAKRKDTIAAFEELAAKEKEQADLVKFHLQANYNSRKVMYAGLMREMDEADAARVAKEKARASQAGRDDRGYTPFAVGTVGGNRAAAEAPKLDREQTLQEAETRAFLRRRALLDGELEAINKTKKAYKSLGAHIAEVIGIYRVYNTAINLTEQALLSVPKALIELQTATATLTATFGSFAGASRELAFLNDEAASTGIAISTLRDSYAQASASFIMAGESAATTRAIFRDINTVATTLHLNADRVSSVFLALSQIFNKGKVQAEELTKQLSQTLPGITNQTAKALGLSAAALGESMKKGLISAHDAVRAISKQIADTFGGEAFTRAADGLNASLGRLSTAWTLFSESMGKSSESIMKTFIDMATSSLEALTKLTSHTEQTTTVLNILFGVLSGAIIFAAIAGLEKLAIAMATFTFSIPVVGQLAALGAGIAAIGSYFYISGKQAEDAAKSYRKALDAERLRQTGGVAPLRAIKLQRPEDNQAYKDALEVQKSANKALKEAIKGEGAPISVVATLKEDLKLANDLVARTYKEALQEPVETVKKESVNVSNDIAKAHEMFLEATGKKVEARRLAFMRNNAEQIEKLKLAIGEGNQEAVTALMDIYGSYQAIQETEKKPKKPTSSSSEGYKAALEDVKNITESIKGSVSEALGNIETLYQSNLLSLKDYFSQKKQLILTDAAVERQGIEARLQLAFAQKDRVAVEKLQGELIKSRTEETKNSTKAIQEETAALKARQDMLAGIQSEYARTFVTMVSTTEAIDAAERKYLAANGDKILQLELEVKAGNEVAEARLKELYALKDNFVIQEQLTDLETKRNELVTEYEATLQRINNQLQSGTLSPLEAGYMSDEAKDRLTTNLEDLKAKQQEVLTSQGTGIKLSDRIKREVEKSNNYLEDLKATGSRVGEGFKTVFSNSVTSAFTSFAMGTATAKQAFQSFAVSIVQGIAQIIAQEIALKAVKGVMSMFSMSFGGATSVAAGNSEAFTSSMSSSNFWGSSLGSAGLQGNANGGVFSGAGISAYSGSIVDKPTVFPFAKGTGLMGEAGPEVILPLKRNSQNELGVVSESGGQSNSNVYNIAVTVQSSKDEKPSDTGQKIAEAMMRTIAKQEIGNAARLGNSLNRTTKFG